MISGAQVALALEVDGSYQAFQLKAGPMIFDIAGSDISYISIKDQTIRARILSSWLAQMDQLRSANGMGSFKKVLVIGAGVAGASFAVDFAARCTYAEVHLIEKNSMAFGLQARTNTRYVSLTQFDWPAIHAGNHEFPYSDWNTFSISRSTTRAPCPVTSTTAPMSAKQLATKWQANLTTQATTYPAFSSGMPMLWFETEVISTPISTKHGAIAYAVSLSQRGTMHNMKYDLIISAIGFASEGIPSAHNATTSKMEPVTPSFWQDDDLADIYPVDGQAIAIVGNGDGALQDFIRIMFDESYMTAWEIITQIERHLSSSASALAWEEFKHRMTLLDRQTALSVPWMASPGQAWKDLDRDCGQLVKNLLTNNSSLLPFIVSLMRTQLPSAINWFCRQQTPDKVYLLNRVLYHFVLNCCNVHVYSKNGYRSWFNRPLTCPVIFYIANVTLDNTSIVSNYYLLDDNTPAKQYGRFDRVIWRTGPVRSGRAHTSTLSTRRALGANAQPYHSPDRFQF